LFKKGSIATVSVANPQEPWAERMGNTSTQTNRRQRVSKTNFNSWL